MLEIEISELRVSTERTFNVQPTVQPMKREQWIRGLWMTHHQCVTIRRWTIVTCTAKCLTVSRLNPIRVFLSTLSFHSYESFLWSHVTDTSQVYVSNGYPSLFKIFGKWQWAKISGSLCSRWRKEVSVEIINLFSSPSLPPPPQGVKSTSISLDNTYNRSVDPVSSMV